MNTEQELEILEALGLDITIQESESEILEEGTNNQLFCVLSLSAFLIAVLEDRIKPYTGDFKLRYVNPANVQQFVSGTTNPVKPIPNGAEVQKQNIEKVLVKINFKRNLSIYDESQVVEQTGDYVLVSGAITDLAMKSDKITFFRGHYNDALSPDSTSPLYSKVRKFVNKVRRDHFDVSVGFNRHT